MAPLSEETVNVPCGHRVTIIVDGIRMAQEATMAVLSPLPQSRSLGAPDEAGGERRRVLIIADGGAQEALELFATIEGCEAMAASHGAAAEAAIKTWQPDAILVEFSRLGVEADRMLQRYRAVSAAHVPIILVTPESGVGRFAEVGLAGVLVRPFPVGELLDVLDRLAGCR
jgi:hypothetical protein